MLTLLYREESQTVRSEDASQLARLLADEQRIFWLDMEAPTEAEFALLESAFHFHPLALDDAAHPKQMPKVNEYDGYSFLIADEVTVDWNQLHAEAEGKSDNAHVLEDHPFCAFLSEHYLVTVHPQSIQAIHALRDVCQQNRRLFDKGTDFLLYTLLDILVDDYFPLLDELEDQMDELEDQVIMRPKQDVLEQIFAMKRELGRLRKRFGPLRHAMQTLLTRKFPGIQEETLPYFREVDDHLFRIYDALDSYRDLSSNLLDAYLSQVNNEMNRVMRNLTAVSVIFLPLTFLTGFFGMNFDKQPWSHTNPLHWLIGMLVIASLTLVVLWRRHWL